MAPEQAERHPRVTAATDRYALGLVAYRLLMGESYYRGSVMSILAELLHGPTTAPSARDPSFGPAFDTWFAQACHRDPERRFASASQQVEALAGALGVSSGSGNALHERRSSAPPDGATAQGLGVRAFAAAGLLLALIAAALAYRASTAHHADASVAPGVSASVRREPQAPSLVVVPMPEAPSAGGVVALSSEPTVAPSPSPYRPAPVAASVKGAPEKPRPGGARTITASAPPKARGPDPFGDQK
jgi:serine/threonine-protein kinase